MSANANETVLDILAEMRKETGELKDRCCGTRVIHRMEDSRVLWYLYRIEAAWKRERDAIYAMLDNSLAKQRTTNGEHQVAVSKMETTTPPGNAAAMREALLSLYAWAQTVKENPKDKTAVECAEFVEQTAKEAIKKPPRIVDAHTDWRDALKAAIAKCESWRHTACLECPWFIPHTTGVCLMRRLYSEVKNESEVNDEHDA